MRGLFASFRISFSSAHSMSPVLMFTRFRVNLKYTSSTLPAAFLMEEISPNMK